jgi:uncharacterized membrane protein YeaQ/YmgE (transglycosylase-associated protein family)
MLPWSRRFPYSRRSGLDTARLVLGLHRHIALLPSRQMAWLWCAIPAAGVVAWALAWLRPPRAALLLEICGLLGGLVTGWFAVVLAKGRADTLGSGVIVAATGAVLLVVASPFCRRRLSPEAGRRSRALFHLWSRADS